MSQLKQQYRQVIVLRHIENLSMKETGRILGWSEAKVRTTTHRAMAKLRQLLDPNLEEANPSMTQIITSYFPNVLAYQDGAQTIYIQSPELYAWLKSDKWMSEFQQESYTDVEKTAIQAVMSSTWGGILQGLFPTVPGVSVSQIPHGGPAPLDGKSALLPGTCTTVVQPERANTRMKFSET